jgi:hypothetical protein
VGCPAFQIAERFRYCHNRREKWTFQAPGSVLRASSSYKLPTDLSIALLKYFLSFATTIETFALDPHILCFPEHTIVKTCTIAWADCNHRAAMLASCRGSSEPFMCEGGCSESIDTVWCNVL